MLENPRRHHHWIPIGVVITVLTVLSGCTKEEQAQLQTAVVQAGQTAIAEGKKIAETEAVHLKETAIAQVATQLANVATELAKTSPQPWDVSWLPSDSQLIIDRINFILSTTGLEGQGATILDTAQESGVNPAFALAMFRKEASFAAPDTRANTNKNPGNISATGDCYGKPANSSCKGNYGEISTEGASGSIQAWRTVSRPTLCFSRKNTNQALNAIAPTLPVLSRFTARRLTVIHQDT